MPSVSKSQIGIQNTDEYAPHGEKSCGHIHSRRPPKNSIRQMPRAEAGPGANQKVFQHVTACLRNFIAVPRQ